MRIRRGFGIGDFFREAMDDMASGFEYFPSSGKSYSIIGELVDTSKFDVIPKESYRQELLKKKEEEIEALDRQHESDEKYYQERRKNLVEEKETLTRELKQKNS